MKENQGLGSGKTNQLPWKIPGVFDPTPISMNHATVRRGALGGSKNRKAATKIAKNRKTVSKIIENQNHNVCVAF